VDDITPNFFTNLGLSLPPTCDIGVNLLAKRTRPLDVIRRARLANVQRLILTGCSIKGSRANLKFIKDNKKKLPDGMLYTTIGVHPHDAKSCGKSTILEMRELIKQGGSAVVAIGETGLDYNRNFSAPDVQRKWFEEQVKLACELGMPLFCHEREASADFLTILEKYKPPAVVVHCFTGTKSELKAYINKGYYIGLTGFICKSQRGKLLREFANQIPIDRLMVETDSPYMGFKEKRLQNCLGRHNEPLVIPFIIETIAKCYSGKFSISEIAGATWSNTNVFFRLDEHAQEVEAKSKSLS